MKKTSIFIAILMVMSSSAFAGVKTLICDDTLLKVAVQSDSKVFRGAESGTPDEEMLADDDYIDTEGTVAYDAASDKFTADTKMGDYPIRFESMTDENGQPRMTWTNLDDGTTDTMMCHEL